MTYDELKNSKQLFVDKYLELGDRNEAYLAAGYSVEGRGWKANARKMFLELESIIKERIDLRIGEGSILALGVIREIMEDKNVSPAVRLNAAKDYLQRAGYDKPIETTLNINSLDKASDEEIDAEIQTLLKIVPASEAPKVS